MAPRPSFLPHTLMEGGVGWGGRVAATLVLVPTAPDS